MLKSFEKFSKSNWELEIWPACNALQAKRSNAGRQGDKPIFQSEKSGVQGLLDFVKNYENVSRRDEKRSRSFVIFDKIVGRAAALLIVYLKENYENISRRDEKRSRSLEVYGVFGSKLAARTLRKYKIKFYFQKTVPSILNKDKTDFCPLERLSFSKSPEDFYNCLRKRA